jgi:hypothetical protein
LFVLYRASPCVILLRHFGTLRALPSGLDLFFVIL